MKLMLIDKYTNIVYNICMNKKEYMKQYYIDNKERISKIKKEYMKQYYKDNTEKMLKENQQWRENNKKHIRQYNMENKEKTKEYYKKYYIENKEDIIEKCKEYYKEHKKEIKAYQQRYYQDNIEMVRKKKNKYCKYKTKTNLKFNLNCRMRTAIRLALKGNKKGRHWEDLVSYTLDDLIKHLKKTMPIGYIWEDYIEDKLQVDHIIPINAYNFTKPEHTDFKRCWALSNLQLLPAKENLIKNKKVFKHFQPALQI